MNNFINYIQAFHNKLMLISEEINNQTYFEKSISELKSDNEYLFNDLLEEKYAQSYLNPDYAVTCFGEIGQTISVFYSEYRNMIKYVFKQETRSIHNLNNMYDTFIEALKLNANKKQLEQILLQNLLVDIKESEVQALNEDYNPTYSFYKDVAEKIVKDKKYLYAYGIYVDQTILDFYELANKMPKEKIDKLAHIMVDSYLKGFKARGKEIKTRNISRVISIAGLEKISLEILNYLNQKELIGHIAVVTHKEVNPQFTFDHKDDKKLITNKDYIDLRIKAYEEALDETKGYLEKYLGNIIMVLFGTTQKPLNNAEHKLVLDAEESALWNLYNNEKMALYNQYVDKKEISYTGMAYCNSDICETDYDKVFDAVMDINCVDGDKIESLQRKLVATLDQAKNMHIKGKNGNLTDIVLTLNPNKKSDETNFWNCGSDVNIPAGEVYTAPKLENTNGIIHVKEVLVGTTLFHNLKIEVKNGVTVSYQSDDNPEQLKSKLFYASDNLPLGELAIGTNTVGYVLSKRLGILNKLHTLIGEKMGPHIAIGDTCNCRSEDACMVDYVTNKKFVAVENEISAMRRFAGQKPYFNTHTDITIPYDDLAYIECELDDGSFIKIIEEGRFVLAGLEELNLPFENE